jgi:hypothetical protein
MDNIIGNSRKHDISFSQNGKISIAARISHALNLKKGDVIDLLVDKENREIYIYVKFKAPNVGRHEGTVAFSNKHGAHCITYSKIICYYIRNNYGNKSYNCGTPIEHKIYGTIIPIITNNIL